MILSILKVIGVVLLIILALIIFILLLLLFIPIRYRFWGSYDDTLDGEAVIKWEPVLLKAFAAYHNKQLEYTVWLFGGVVMTNTAKKLSWIGRRFFVFGDGKEDESASSMESEGFDFQESNVAFGDEERRKGNVFRDEEDLQQEETILKEPGQKNDGKAEKRVRKSFFLQIKKKKRAFQKRWKEFVKRLRKIQNKKEALLKVYHSKRFEQAKYDLKQYAGEILCILKPDRLEGDIRFGLEDPANTGYVLGVLAMLLPLYQGFLTVEPDFTQQIIKGNLKGNGKIKLISVVKLVIKVILNKNLIKVTKKVQTILQE
ncbi:MAG: DUF2953 domain-containing protein [Lachnospiraceae bacterium]|nr:DUF2953 domain-containing protein [Lachnospiraceae bacterium]